MANKENIQKWVDALRSGEYLQTFGVLEFVDGDGKSRNCCLGVATRVFMKDNPGVLTPVTMAGGYTNFSWEELEQSDLLPVPVIGWLGIEDANPLLIIEDYDETHELATTLNDNKDYMFTFEQIANVVEKTYLSE